MVEDYREQLGTITTLKGKELRQMKREKENIMNKSVYVEIHKYLRE